MHQFTNILETYSSNDNLKGCDKITVHSYGEQYSSILSEISTRPNVTILEIGIMSGAFLQALHEFLPGAQLYGVDIDLSRYRYNKCNPKIQLYEMDGTSPETAAALNTSFDLIVEDASHTAEHQKRTLDVFAPYLKKGGYYVVEDISQNNEVHKQALQTIGEKHNLSMTWVDLTSVKNRNDDVLALFYLPK